jgi:hypothetical protein
MYVGQFVPRVLSAVTLADQDLLSIGERGAAVERLRYILRQPGFQITAFIFSFLLLGWPLLSLTSVGPDVSIPVYLFLLWGFIIISLFFVARSLSDEDGAD